MKDLTEYSVKSCGCAAGDAACLIVFLHVHIHIGPVAVPAPTVIAAPAALVRHALIPIEGKPLPAFTADPALVCFQSDAHPVPHSSASCLGCKSRTKNDTGLWLPLRRHCRSTSSMSAIPGALPRHVPASMTRSARRHSAICSAGVWGCTCLRCFIRIGAGDCRLTCPGCSAGLDGRGMRPAPFLPTEQMRDILLDEPP